MSHLDVLMQFLKTVYSHLMNKKKMLKKFLEYINDSSSYKLKILIKNKMINRRSSNIRLATCSHNTKILSMCI